MSEGIPSARLLRSGALRLAFVTLNLGHFKQGLVYKANRMWTPYSVAIMAAMQRGRGHVCRVVDANACGLSMRETVRALLEHRADIAVLVTQPTDRWQNPYPSIEGQREFSRLLRASGFTGVLVALGPQPSLLPEHYLRHIPQTDVILTGEPEPALDALVYHLQGGLPAAQVPGAMWLHQGEVVRAAPPQRVENLDALPLPAFDLLPMQNYQFHFYSRLIDPQHRFAFIETTRGCPYACSFCNLSLYGTRVRRFSVQRVLREIDLLVQKWRVNYLFFGDLTFGIHKKDTRELLEGLVERNYPLRWSCQTRVDILDESMLALMSRAGCHRIEAGIETAAPELLADVKNVEIRRLREFIAMLADFDIKLETGHLLGLPGQTARDVIDSARFMRALGVRFKITAVVVPYPGTREFETGRAEGKITAPDWPAIVRAAGKCGNTFSSLRLRWLHLRVQGMYYWHVFSRGLMRLPTSGQGGALVRGLLRLPVQPRTALGGLKRLFEDALYGKE